MSVDFSRGRRSGWRWSNRVASTDGLFCIAINSRLLNGRALAPTFAILADETWAWTLLLWTSLWIKAITRKELTYSRFILSYLWNMFPNRVIFKGNKRIILWNKIVTIATIHQINQLDVGEAYSIAVADDSLKLWITSLYGPLSVCGEGL